MELRIAGAQIPVTRQIDQNEAVHGRVVEFASAEDADILLTPEGSLSGYTHEFDPAAAAEALARITSLARDRGLGLALGTCFVEPDDGRCYNQIRWYAPSGEYLGFHSKTLTCGSLDTPPRGEVEHYSVAPLRTFDVAGIPCGGLICNDMWANPGCTPGPDTHLVHQLSVLGARVVFHAVNGGRDSSDWAREVVWPFHESNLRMRAQSSRMWIVTVDNCDPVDLPCSAPSGILDPSGNWVCRVANQGEGMFVHSIDIDM